MFCMPPMPINYFYGLCKLYIELVVYIYSYSLFFFYIYLFIYRDVYFILTFAHFIKI